MLSITLLLILVVFLAVCISVGNARDPKRIFTENIINIRDVPHQVSLHAKGQHICGGSIISRKHILTIANCLILSPGVYQTNIRVFSGASDRLNLTNAQVHDVSHFIFHEDFNPSKLWANDIAILYLKTQIIISTFRSPASLYIHHLRSSQLVTAVTWRGKDERTIGLLKNMTLKIFHQKTCGELFTPYGKVNSEQACVGSSRLSAWMDKGDAGNAILRYGEITGLVSVGVMNRPDLPVIITRISPYADWINQVLQS